MPGLSEGDLTPHPLDQFLHWWGDAGHDEEVALATASPDGVPSARMVLLRGVDAGFVFFTRYTSAKAADLETNPMAALLFRWPPDRQVRVTGPVARVTREETEAYWDTRPRGSQIGAWASEQSTPIASRAALEARAAEVATRFGGDATIPAPPAWGGYRLIPEVFEFWHHRDDRLHDRLRYRRVTGSWVVDRLSP